VTTKSGEAGFTPPGRFHVPCTSAPGRTVMLCTRPASIEVSSAE
jgi:hypothetical protein